MTTAAAFDTQRHNPVKDTILKQILKEELQSELYLSIRVLLRHHYVVRVAFRLRLCCQHTWASLIFCPSWLLMLTTAQVYRFLTLLDSMSDRVQYALATVVKHLQSLRANKCGMHGM